MADNEPRKKKPGRPKKRNPGQQKADLVINLRDQLMTEQALLFDKMKQELTIKMHKELIRMRKNLENKRQEVYSSWTQVEAGDFPLNNNEDAESSLDSVNLLAE